MKTICNQIIRCALRFSELIGKAQIAFVAFFILLNFNASKVTAQVSAFQIEAKVGLNWYVNTPEAMIDHPFFGTFESKIAGRHLGFDLHWRPNYWKQSNFRIVLGYFNNDHYLQNFSYQNSYSRIYTMHHVKERSHFLKGGISYQVPLKQYRRGVINFRPQITGAFVVLKEEELTTKMLTYLEETPRNQRLKDYEFLPTKFSDFVMLSPFYNLNVAPQFEYARTTGKSGLRVFVSPELSYSDIGWVIGTHVGIGWSIN